MSAARLDAMRGEALMRMNDGERVKLVYEVKITLDNADGVFKPGMPAEAGLRAAEGATD